VLEGRAQPRRSVGRTERGAEETRPQHTVGKTSELVAHPLTAPATMPLARRRCTITKKIMTGMVMIVDAAMMLPQSLECRPKNDLRDRKSTRLKKSRMPTSARKKTTGDAIDATSLHRLTRARPEAR